MNAEGVPQVRGLCNAFGVVELFCRWFPRAAFGCSPVGGQSTLPWASLCSAFSARSQNRHANALARLYLGEVLRARFVDIRSKQAYYRGPR